MENRNTRAFIRFLVKIGVFFIVWCIYRGIVGGDLIPNWRTENITPVILIGVFIIGIVNAVVDEIPALDPDEILYAKLRQGTYKMFQEASARAQEEIKQRHEENNK